MPSSNAPVHARITGPVVMIGFGSIGKGTLPLIERQFDYDKSRFVIIDPREDGGLAKSLDGVFRSWHLTTRRNARCEPTQRQAGPNFGCKLPIEPSC